jgi:hypothetical protein
MKNRLRKRILYNAFRILQNALRTFLFYILSDHNVKQYFFCSFEDMLNAFYKKLNLTKSGCHYWVKASKIAVITTALSLTAHSLDFG